MRPNGFAITKSISYRNAHQTEAAGQYQPTDHGVRIRIRLGLSRFTLAWFTCCYLVLIAFSMAPHLIAMQAGVTISSPMAFVALAKVSAPLLGVLAVMFMLIGALKSFGRWRARTEADFLVRFLTDTLEAHEVPSP